jgi:Ca-activated chloride channel family protein
MSSVVIQQATEANEKAVQLRDEGKVEEAKDLLMRNAQTLRESASKLSAPELESYGAANEADARAMEKGDWDTQRKKMRSQQHANQTQQSY